MSTTANNPLAVITDGLDFAVDIYDVYNPNGNPKGLLTYTKLGTAAAHGAPQTMQSMRLASQLQAMRTGSIAALNNNYYHQFPVAVLAVSPFNDSNSFALTTDMQQGMEQAFKFIKYSQANADAQMAKDFRTALGNTTGQKTAVDTFFKGTGSFQQCTLASWTAVLSWQAQFTSAWQGTYYLYSVVEGTVTTANAPALVATLTILSSASGDSATLTMAGTGGESTPVVMVGDGSMQEQNAGTGNLSVALTPVWMNVAQTSQQNGQTVTNYRIGAAFTGTINGVKVAGNINQLTIPSADDTSKSAGDKDKSNGLSMSTLFQVGGLLTSVGMLYYMAKGHKEANTQQKNDSQKDGDTKDSTAKKEQQIDNDYQQKDVKEVNEQAQTVEADAVPKVKDAYKQVDQANEIAAKNDMADQQIDKLKEMIKEGAPSQATEDTAESLLEVKESLRDSMDAEPAQRDNLLDDVDAKLNDVSTNLDQALQEGSAQREQAETDALTETQEAVKEQLEQTESVEKAQEEHDKETEQDPSEDVDDGTFDDPEPMEPIGE